MNGLALLFGDFEGACKKLLFLETEQLLVRQFVLSAACALQEPQRKDPNISLVRVDTVENRTQIVKRVLIADHYKDISRPDTQPLWGEIIATFEIELIQLRMFSRSSSGRSLGYGKNGEKYKCETHARNSSDLLGHQVDHTQA